MSGCLAFVLLFALHAPSSIPCCVEISENASIPFLLLLAPLRQFIGLGALLVFLLSKRLMEGEKERRRRGPLCSSIFQSQKGLLGGERWSEGSSASFI